MISKETIEFSLQVVFIVFVINQLIKFIFHYINLRREHLENSLILEELVEDKEIREFLIEKGYLKIINEFID